MSRKKAISNSLRKVFLQGGKMEYALYKYELEEHIEDWYAGLKSDREEMVFVVTENSGLVAMVLIMKDGTIYVNEDAREKLSKLWVIAYRSNFKQFIPKMAEDIDDGFFAVNGVYVIDTSKRQLGI